MTVKRDPLKEPRVAFVDLVDIPRAIDIAPPLPGKIESRKNTPFQEKAKQEVKKPPPLPEEKGYILQGKVPDLPVNPDLPPEKVLPEKIPEIGKDKSGEENKAPTKSLPDTRKVEKNGESSESREGGGESGKVPRIKDLTPSLGKMVLAAKRTTRKGAGEGTGDNIGTEGKPKDTGEYAEIAEGGTTLTSLDTPSIQYISYFAGIKRKIELVWQYPFDAIQRGIQGDLVLDFSITKTGSLKGIKLVRSSGFTILDDEAIESIRKAAPFSPIPDQYNIDELNIRANFVYEMHFLKIR